MHCNFLVEEISGMLTMDYNQTMVKSLCHLILIYCPEK